MKKIFIIWGVIVSLTLSLVGCSKPKVESENSKQTSKVELNISAAASLKEAMAKIGEEYSKDNKNVKLVINYGSSGSLQKQIEQGAPCDVFISAGKKQMDALNDGNLLLEGRYKDLVKNDLVLIANKDSNIKNIDDLNTNKVKHVAIGEPDSVPAGKYADEVLTNLNIKSLINDKLVFAKDVKEVLAWTQSKNAEVGFVYYSDALNSKDIKIIETTKEDTHSPIIYPIAVIKDSKEVDEAKKFEEFLLSDKGQDILKDFGYKNSK